jgi:hypothetical protein
MIDDTLDVLLSFFSVARVKGASSIGGNHRMQLLGTSLLAEISGQLRGSQVLGLTVLGEAR